jgi:hypothetical protein
MTTKRNKLVIHACGGAGINVADKVFSMVADLGEGFAEVKINYIDTSKANYDKIEPVGDFWQVKTKTKTTAELDGTGSERAKNSKIISENVREYLDHHNTFNIVTGEFHCVVFSTAGGSGSVIGPVMLKELLSRDIPVFGIVIGDSSNGLSAMNTLNTLASLDSIANKVTKKPLGIIYENNHTRIGETNHGAAEKEVNNILFNTLSAVAMFLSGENEAIDNQDMVGLIDQSHYSRIKVEPGIYTMTIHAGEVKLPKESIPTVARSLTKEGTPYDIDVTLLHHKRGFVTAENALSIYGEQFPIHIVMAANAMVSEMDALNASAENYNNIMKNIKTKQLESSINTDEDEDGMVF